MEASDQMIAEVTRQLSLVYNKDDTNPRMGGLLLVKAGLGDEAVEVIRLGLSRPISPTPQDSHALITEWESRSDLCCFQGSVDDLLSQRNTFILALSYKHDHHSNWKRKGDKFISKMSQEDQDTLVSTIVGLGKAPLVTSVIVWCDQILSTRLVGRENSFGWYNAGLLPYLCQPVLTLSSYIPDEQLESRIWIKAERTLGRLGHGLLSPKDARIGVNSSWGAGVDRSTVLQNVALMMLSGYWPADTGFWANDYQDMKKWAVGLVCRKQSILELPLFDEIKAVDNLEILASLPALVMLPEGLEGEEKPLFTNDNAFFLKATAWNLSLEEIWKRDAKCISHYLGRLGEKCRFTWWTESRSQAIFGCFVTVERACLVLAVRDENGYKLFRREGDPMLYQHKETPAGKETKLLIADMVQKCHANVNSEAEWNLLYFKDDLNTHMTDPQVKIAMEEASSEADAVVPLGLVGHTTGLYRAALARNAACGKSEAERFLHLFKEWNGYVKKTYDNWISVRDTISGPVWLEGYNDRHVSFGFLDTLTRNLILGDRYVSDHIIHLPTKWDTVKEIKRVAESSTEDLKLIERELYGKVSERSCESDLTTEEVARCILSGAFSSGFDIPKLSSFLSKTAERRGYWSTDMYCDNGEIQILFRNGQGNVRIARRPTELGDFLAVGIVVPEDSDVVMDISEEIIEEADLTRVYKYWKQGLVRRVSKSDVIRQFSRSCRDIGDGRTVCLVDMTVSNEDEEDVCSALDAYREDVAGNEERDQLMEKFVSYETELLKQPTDSASSADISLPHIEDDFEKRMAFMRKKYEEKLKFNEMVRAVADESIRLSREVNERQGESQGSDLNRSE